MVARVASFLLFLVMLGVTASSSGLVSARQAMAEMPGMNMGGSPGAPAHDDHAPADQGCKFPWSPGCTAFSPCAPAALIATVAETRVVGEVDRTVVVAVVTKPASADRSPDHPPPRVG